MPVPAVAASAPLDAGQSAEQNVTAPLPRQNGTAALRRNDAVAEAAAPQAPAPLEAGQSAVQAGRASLPRQNGTAVLLQQNGAEAAAAALQAPAIRQHNFAQDSCNGGAAAALCNGGSHNNAGSQLAEGRCTGGAAAQDLPTADTAGKKPYLCTSFDCYIVQVSGTSISPHALHIMIR